MASINKLSVRGVRAFSPNDEEQVISFCFPLTIIVGANGCGKTTIIESLKYAVTGSLPPGNKSGQSFVHDPRAMGQSSSKASIKLRITGMNGMSMVVARSMEVTQKKTNASFKALDGTIRTVDADGNRITQSHKTGEMDKSVPTYLGVSKPILEHVVFCHQEDSSWPLQEGAVLKKRFDDIFDSTKYAKALEAIKKEKKEYKAQEKDLKAELEGLKSHKHAARGYRDDLEKCRTGIATIHEKMEALKEEIEEKNNEAKKAQDDINEIEELQGEIDEQTNKVETMKAVADKQRELLGDDDLSEQVDYDQMKEMLSNLRAEGSNEAKQKLQDKLDEMRSTEESLAKLRRKTNEITGRKGKLEAEKEAHEKLAKSRFDTMQSIHENHKLELEMPTQDDTFTQGTQGTTSTFSTMFTSQTGGNSTVHLTDEDLISFQRAVDTRAGQIKSAYNEAKIRHREVEEELQKELLEAKSKQAALTNDLKRVDDEQQKDMRELNEIASQQPSSSRIRQSDVEDAEKEAKKQARERDEENRNARRGEIVNEIRAHEEKLKSISQTIEEDSKVRDQLRLMANDQNEIDMINKQIRQEREILKEKIENNQFQFTEYGENIEITDDNPSAPCEVLVNNMRSRLKEKEAEVKHAGKSANKAQGKLQEKKAIMNSNHSRLVALQGKRSNLLRDEGGIQKIKQCVRALIRNERQEYADDGGELIINEDSPIHEVLSYLDEGISECTRHEINPAHLAKMLKRLKKMAKDSVRCPCCTRDWDHAKELEDFNVRMSELANPDVSELFEAMAANSNDAKVQLEKMTAWRKTINEHLADQLEYDRLVVELSDLEDLLGRDEQAELKKFQDECDKAEKELAEKEDQLKKLHNVAAISNTILESAKRLWEKMGHFKSKKETMEFTYSGMGHISQGDQRKLARVESDLADLGQRKEQCYTSINQLNNEQKTINERISTKTNQAATADHRFREMQARFRKEQDDTKRIEELKAHMASRQVESKRLRDLMDPCRTRVLQKESDSKRVRKDNLEEDTQLSNVLKTFDRDIDRLNDINNKIELYERANKGSELRRAEEQLVQNHQMIAEKQRELTDMQPQIDDLKKTVDDGERQIKRLVDNIALVKKQLEADKEEKRAAEMQKRLDKMPFDDLNTQKNSAINRCRELDRKVQRYDGKLSGLVDQKKALKSKLNEKEYKNVDEEHRIKMIEHYTTATVCDDLDRYYEALDKALLRYHGIKIADINKIIRELWALTYKGEDITNIEIQSGQDSSSRANRSYNYRIVMSKGNSQMDMRGRCSAGQRVLASIVIRLALAETFCLNCGVMALDEPTTNLDFENKRGLGIALAQIIASRASQSNFQLVVITHDEDFVSMMKQELSSLTGFSMPERYFQVSREESTDGRYYSKIHSIDWDEL